MLTPDCTVLYRVQLQTVAITQTNCADPVFQRLFPELVELQHRRLVARESSREVTSAASHGGGTDAAGNTAATVDNVAGGATDADAAGVPAVADKGWSSSAWMLILVVVVVAVLYRRWHAGVILQDGL